MAIGAAHTLLKPCRLPRLLSRSALVPLILDSGLQMSSSARRDLFSSRPSAGSFSNSAQSQARQFSTPADTTELPSSPTKFNYNVAASYIAKGRTYNPATHVFHFSPYNRVQLPKRKRKQGRPESGQDAFFVSRLGESPAGVALGVADGVGGWMDSGVDPADFSHALCDYMASSASEHKTASGPGSAWHGLTARQVMQRGYDAVCHDGSVEAGGSTAIVGLFGEGGKLEVANLGDSGFIHLRPNAVHAYSEPQTHAFNTPYQLSIVPPSMLARAAAFGGAQLMDQPRDAEVTRHQLRHGDVLVFASDGLWDNLFNQDILRIVSRTMTDTGAWARTDGGVRVVSDLAPFTNVDPSAVAEAEERAKAVGQRPVMVTLQSVLATEIVASAKAASLNSKLDGPFAKEVKKYYPHEAWHGGKEDDICLVVVVVSEEAQAAPKARL